MFHLFATEVIDVHVMWLKVVLQPLCWHCVECAIPHERDVHKQQYPYTCGANKQ